MERKSQKLHQGQVYRYCLPLTLLEHLRRCIGVWGSFGKIRGIPYIFRFQSREDMVGFLRDMRRTVVEGERRESVRL